MVSRRHHPSAALRAGLATGLFVLTISLAALAQAQQYQNFEVTPNGRGGAHGTIGGRNFEIERNYDRPPANHRSSSDMRRDYGSSVPQQTCLIDTKGRTRCN
ncbi:hypothetical protein [Agrobacterium sp. V1]|uniref:hypothetical protein n=1 Tax=Agrobacterium sp. V1 TaxID=3061957 RepID=UPI002673CEBE|nr:hypothetical protein [Agrobacterium sp. V1]MDO3443811.1 hypothetical protein [Agrobacterium sp. V1]